MTAIEHLLKMLDERGVEWWDDSESIYWDGIDGTSWTAERRRAGDLYLCSIGCTPEQAIAATLGRPTFDANLEQALSFMRIWISDDAHLGESELSAAFEKAEGLRKLDAIEDAIAATVGAGTCKPIESQDCLAGTDCPAWLCSECGELFERGANYCPNCGAKVVGE